MGRALAAVGGKGVSTGAMTRLTAALESALEAGSAASALAEAVEAALGGPTEVVGAFVLATSAADRTGEDVGRLLAARWPAAELLGTSFEGLALDGRVWQGEPAVGVLAWTAGDGAPIPIVCEAGERDPDVLAKEIFSAGDRVSASAEDLVLLFPDALGTSALRPLLDRFSPAFGGPWLAGAAATRRRRRRLAQLGDSLPSRARPRSSSACCCRAGRAPSRRGSGPVGAASGGGTDAAEFAGPVRGRHPPREPLARDQRLPLPLDRCPRRRAADRLDPAAAGAHRRGRSRAPSRTAAGPTGGPTPIRGRARGLRRALSDGRRPAPGLGQRDGQLRPGRPARPRAAGCGLGAGDPSERGGRAARDPADPAARLSVPGRVASRRPGCRERGRRRPGGGPADPGRDRSVPAGLGPGRGRPSAGPLDGAGGGRAGAGRVEKFSHQTVPIKRTRI